MYEDTTSTWACLIGFWFICGLIAGSIYRNKGRSEAAGCLVGFLLGPIGILLALASSRDEVAVLQRDEAKKLKSRQYERCQHCHELVRTEAAVCPHCRRERSPAQLPPAR